MREPPLRYTIRDLEMCVYKCGFRDGARDIDNLQGRTFDFQFREVNRDRGGGEGDRGSESEGHIYNPGGRLIWGNNRSSILSTFKDL